MGADDTVGTEVRVPTASLQGLRYAGTFDPFVVGASWAPINSSSWKSGMPFAFGRRTCLAIGLSLTVVFFRVGIVSLVSCSSQSRISRPSPDVSGRSTRMRPYGHSLPCRSGWVLGDVGADRGLLFADMMCIVKAFGNKRLSGPTGCRGSSRQIMPTADVGRPTVASVALTSWSIFFPTGMVSGPLLRWRLGPGKQPQSGNVDKATWHHENQGSARGGEHRASVC